MTAAVRFRIAYRLADGSIEPVACNVRGLDLARRTAATFLAPGSYTGRPTIVEVYPGTGRKGPNGFEWKDFGPVALVGTVNASGGIDWAVETADDGGHRGRTSSSSERPEDGQPLTIFDALALTEGVAA